jgi:hypothetical protein
VYEACTDTWSNLPVVGTWPGRYGASKNGVYIIGGRLGDTYHDDVHRFVLDVAASEVRFEPVTVATDGDGLPGPRWAHVTALVSGSIFMYGGNAGTADFFRNADFEYADLWELRIRR